MERSIHFQLDLDAPIQAVWDAWTTEAGLISFFAPAVNIDLRPGGPYEIFFSPENSPGTRGADGMFVLAFQAPTFLAFTSTAFAFSFSFSPLSSPRGFLFCVLKESHEIMTVEYIIT